MENGEKKESFVKKVGAVFNKLDNKICNVHQKIMTKMLDKENQARVAGNIGKTGFKTAGAFIVWLMALPCHASKYSTHKYKQAFVRICASAILAFLPATLLLFFVEQVCPSYKEFIKDNAIIVWTVMTVLMLAFLMKCGLVLIRIVTCLLILAVLMVSCAFFLSDAASETRSVLFVVAEVLTAVFFLLWNFWPKKFKELPTTTDNE